MDNLPNQGLSSTSSFEALDPHDPNLSRLATITFEKTQSYLHGELISVQDSYKKLEEMNQLTLSKYSDIHRITENLSSNMTNLNTAYLSVIPFLEKIDILEENIAKLEKMAYALEAYSKKLENKYNSFPKI